MGFAKPRTENERLLASVLLVFVIYFGLNSLIFAFYEEQNSIVVRYFMSLSFLGGVLAGVLFFLWSKPRGGIKPREIAGSPLERNLAILEHALKEDEVLLLRMIVNSEGVTQDSLRFRSGFSKSKVSALLLGMEKNGIVYREKLGRTYKVTIADWLRKE
jgi:uncharacterized membrane protein